MRYAKTELGIQAIRCRNVPLTARQRTALVLCDGKRTGEHVMQDLSSVGSSSADLGHLIAQGLVVEVLDPGEKLKQDADKKLAAVPAQERYQRAYPIANRLSSSLGLKGFALTLALERSTSYEQLCSVAARLRTLVAREDYDTLHEALYQ